jgi:hypothetical protein
MREWVPCIAAATAPPRRGLSTQNGGRREADRRRPRGASSAGSWSHPWPACCAYYAHVPVHRCYPLVRARLEQLAGDELLQRQHHAVLAPYADCCAAVLDGFDCIFDLEVAAVRRKDRVGQVVARAY